MSKGFDKFDKHDESVDEHLDGLLTTIAAHEKEEGKKIDANVVTWRGMMTKVSSYIYFSNLIDTESSILIASCR